MNTVKDIHDFINLAQKNRKYADNTAHGKRAALKLFETVLHPDELESIELIEERMKEIYLSLISHHQNTFSIASLNTYKGRLLKTLSDYKRYGKDPDSFARWETKERKKKDKDTTASIKKDEIKDISRKDISSSINSTVYNIKVTLQNGQDFSMELPQNLTNQDLEVITKIISSFTR